MHVWTKGSTHVLANLLTGSRLEALSLRFCACDSLASACMRPAVGHQCVCFALVRGTVYVSVLPPMLFAQGRVDCMHAAARGCGPHTGVGKLLTILW